MITIFRQVRNQLIKNNKISKYLLYALGEIILVVLGILIALYINKVNETAKREGQEFEILVQLRQEFENNLTAAHSALERNKKTKKKQQLFLNFTESDSLETAGSKKYLELITQSIGNGVDIYYEDGRLKELIYSGKIQLLTNDSIRSALSGWESTRKDLEDQIEYVNERQIGIMDLMAQKGNLKQIFQHIPNEDVVTFKKIPKDLKLNSALLRSDEFQNKLLLLYYGSVGLNIQILPSYISDLEVMLQLLDKEIAKKEPR